MVSFPFIPSAAKSVTDGRVHPNALLDVQIDRWWNVTLLSSTASLYNASVGVDKLVEVTSCFFFAPLSKLVKVVHAQKSTGLVKALIIYLYHLIMLPRSSRPRGGWWVSKFWSKSVRKVKPVQFPLHWSAKTTSPDPPWMWDITLL